MCGIVGVFGHSPVSQVIYDSLSMLQHRGQDAAGIATCFDGRFYLVKGNGLITDVFDASNMARLLGDMGVGHVRYPTAGCSSVAEAQPFYVNSPYGIIFAHNGNLTNVSEIVDGLFETDMRHLNTNSDSEVMLNVFAHALTRRGAVKPNEFDVFAAVEEVHRRCKGGYAVITMVAGVGMIAFRDLNGIRPLIFGTRDTGSFKDLGRSDEYMIASESVALQVGGFDLHHDLEPGEVIFIDMDGEVHRHVSLLAHEKAPCLFEYVYLARPDSVLDGASVYQCRINMGTKLAAKIRREWAHVPVDVVIPIPSTSPGTEPLRGTDLHHARPGTAQAGHPQEAEPDPRRIQGQECTAGRRFDRAWDDDQGDHRDGARAGCEACLRLLCSATGTLPQRVRYRYAGTVRTDRDGQGRSSACRRDWRR
jgi:amidophosphoribosyltransferase